MLLLLRETLLDPSWPSGRHKSPAAKSFQRLPPTKLPASPVAYGSVGETSGGLAYVRTDVCGRYAIAPLPLSGVSALLTTI